MIFDQSAFDAKVKKAVEAINKLSKSMEEVEKKAKETEEKAKAEEAVKKANEALKAKLKNEASIAAPYAAFDISSYPSSYNSTNYWAQAYVTNAANPYTNLKGLKQEFGKPHNPYSEKDWNEITDQDFAWDLVKTVTDIYTDSYSYPQEFLTAKTGKTGECYVFSNAASLKKYEYAKAYVWHEPYASWFKVPYNMIIDYWNDLQNQKLDNYDVWSSYNQTIAAVPHNPITVHNVNKVGFAKGGTFKGPEPKPVEYEYPAAVSVAKFKASKHPEESLKKYYESVFTKYVVQKTKPSNPKDGTIWSKLVTGTDWKLYVHGYWINLGTVDQKICADIIASKMNEKLEPKSTKKQATGNALFFRANCSNWHEVLNPEKTVIKSVNGKYQWFTSPVSAEKEYGCGHDSKRIIPVFTEQEKENVVKEISAKQNGNIDKTYYIQAGIGKNSNWGEIHAKQTVTVGGRAFHHNSGNKTWYMCLTFDEMKFAKMFKGDLAALYKAAPWTEDAQNIFQDAFPVGKFGFAWFYDGTKPSKSSDIEQQKEMIFDNVQEIANKLAWKGNSNNSSKKKVKDLGEPTIYSDYQSDDETITNYMMAFDHIYDDVYSISQFKSKALSLHKYLMHDIKLASLKKNKTKFMQLADALENLQIKYQEAEQFHVMQNKQNGMYLKPISKVQNMFGYHFDNDYGVPD